MEIGVNELNEKLSYLGFGASKIPNQLEYSDCVMFESGKAYCFSGSTVAVVALDIGFDGAVNYADFATYVRNVNYMDASSTVDMQIEDGALVCRRGRSTTRFPYTPHLVLTLDAVGSPDPNAWKPIPDDFRRAIKHCESIYSREIVSDNVLSCIHITGHHVEAATPDQVIRVKCVMDVPFEFLTKFGRIGKLFGPKYPELSLYQVGDKWLFLKNMDTMYGVPVSRDPFVDIGRFLVYEGDEVEFPDATSLDISLFNSLYAQSGNDVRLEFQGDHCSLSLRSRRGHHSIDVPMTCPSSGSFLMAPTLLRVLAKYGKCSFTDSSVHIHTDRLDYAASVTKEGVDVF